MKGRAQIRDLGRCGAPFRVWGVCVVRVNTGAAPAGEAHELRLEMRSWR